MKKILFFTHKPISHLIPIIDLIESLIKKGNKIYCLGYKEREAFFQERGVTFIEYPKDIEKNTNRLIACLEKKEYEAYNNYNFDLGYQFYLEKNAVYMHYISEHMIDSISSLVTRIKPDIVFHDIVDCYAPIICNRFNIERIDYITNPLYSRYFLESDPTDLYSILTRTLHFDKKMNEKYILNYWENLEKIYNMIEKKYGFIAIPPLNQFQMTGKKNLIFSIECLQPPLDNNNYILIPPSKKQFAIEKNIDKSLKDFFNKKNNIMYVSQGSFLSEDEDFYLDLFKRVEHSELNFVISCGKSTKIVEKIVKKMNMKERVYFSEFVPQKYVLSKADIFFSTGGFNSILEAIYYKTPLIINPISAEQRMNGYWTNKLGIARTLYTKNNNFDLKQIIFEVLNSQKIRDNLNYTNKMLIDSIIMRETIIDNVL